MYKGARVMRVHVRVRMLVCVCLHECAYTGEQSIICINASTVNQPRRDDEEPPDVTIHIYTMQHTQMCSDWISTRISRYRLPQKYLQHAEPQYLQLQAPPTPNTRSIATSYKRINAIHTSTLKIEEMPKCLISFAI